MERLSSDAGVPQRRWPSKVSRPLSCDPNFSYRDAGNRPISGGFAMRVQCLAAVVSVLAVITVVPNAAGQSGKSSPPRTADGKPDLQGTYTFATITPLQRP